MAVLTSNSSSKTSRPFRISTPRAMTANVCPSTLIGKLSAWFKVDACSSFLSLIFTIDCLGLLEASCKNESR